MKTRALLFILAFLSINLSAQSVEESDIEQYSNEVRDMVGFFEYMLNTLGNKETSARDKDVIITQSFNKIFRDGEVQVEDDLDENRDVITNKDVGAYLKDVDFFFKDVTFDFEIEEITHQLNSNGTLFFKVAMLRNLKGLTIENDSVNNTIPRFIEVNYNPENQDLKIVSIYTNEFNEAKALKSWWSSLSYEWRSIFMRKYQFTTDSLSVGQLKKIADTDSLNISGNQFIIDIDALSNLTSLKYLSLKNTKINDVTALRNLTSLTHLNLSNTNINSIDALKYCRSMKRLNLSNTPLKKIDVLENMPTLSVLNLSNTWVDNLEAIKKLQTLRDLQLAQTKITSTNALSELSQLEALNLKQTPVHDLSGLASLKKLETLNLDSTNIVELTPLANLSALRVLSINFTSVSSLKPLQELSNLSNLYCDNTPLLLSTDIAAFAKNHPDALVIYDTKDTENWWISLDQAWRDVFINTLNINKNPGKEALAKINTIDSLNLADNTKITSLEPLRKLTELKYLNLANTGVTSLRSLGKLTQLEELIFSNTEVNTLAGIENLNALRKVEADSTMLVDLGLLQYKPNLKEVHVDNTPVSWKQANTLIAANPQTLIIFESDYLNGWWSSLSEAWKNTFKSQIDKANFDTKDLHRLTQMEKIEFSGNQLVSLEPLKAFIRLKEVVFTNTGISDLLPLTSHDNITKLVASNSPVVDLSPLKKLTQLRILSIANTPVEDLDPLKQLTQLIEIDCSGTQIKRLDDLELLHGLEKLNCSNTNVKRLDPVQYLSLKTLICYNTRINDRRVDDFKSENPNCTVTYY
ncbi:MAG: leucine-rich repeat domain-containing protein [Fulvivirga sp.]